jgi:hypothetical protein
MTWKSFHNRGEILRTVIATANLRRNGVLPMDVPGVAETFGDELSLLATLQLRWHTRLAGHIERELMNQPMDLSGAVEVAWRAAADDLPGVRRILDSYRAEPTDAAMAEAMSKATAKEHMLLATMAGQASFGDPTGAAVGAAIESRARHAQRGVSSLAVQPQTVDARSADAQTEEPQTLEPRTPTLLERLKAVVAA